MSSLGTWVLASDVVGCLFFEPCNFCLVSLPMDLPSSTVFANTIPRHLLPPPPTRDATDCTNTASVREGTCVALILLLSLRHSRAISFFIHVQIQGRRARSSPIL